MRDGPHRTPRPGRLRGLRAAAPSLSRLSPPARATAGLHRRRLQKHKRRRLLQGHTWQGSSASRSHSPQLVTFSPQISSQLQGGAGRANDVNRLGLLRDEDSTRRYSSSSVYIHEVSELGCTASNQERHSYGQRSSCEGMGWLGTPAGRTNRGPYIKSLQCRGSGSR